MPHHLITKLHQLLPQADPRSDVGLLVEPEVMGLPFCFGISQTNLELAQKRRDELVHLSQ
jgi:hypothetical protein